MTGDAGFGMVELLVALAICAALAVGAGGLISLGLKLRDRVELTTDVQRALLDLKAVGSELAGGAWVGLGEAEAADFTLCRNAPGFAPALAGTFSLTDRGVSYRTASASSSADIGVFEARSLEYLVATADEQEWRAAGQLAGARPLAARLKLSLGARTWRVLLWMQQSAPRRQPLAPGDVRCTG